MDPECEEGKAQLAPLFIGESSDDVRRKSQKLQGADSRDWGKLLEVAWVAYRNRDELQSQMNARLVAALEVGAGMG